MGKATFIVTDANGNVFAKYDKIYTGAKHLHQMFQDSRQVWVEYIVSVDADTFQLKATSTYIDEMAFYSNVADEIERNIAMY